MSNFTHNSNRDQTPALEQKVLLLEERNAELKQRIRVLSQEGREQASLVESLLENSPFGMAIMDARRRVIRINRAAEDILNLDRLHAVGQDCSQLFQCFKNKQCCPALEDDAQLDRVETPCTIAGREEVTLLRSAVRSSHQGESILLEAFVDISDIKRGQAAIISAGKAKDEFLDKVSHELRTPLNAIVGYSEMIKFDLQRQANTEEHLDFLSGIHLAGSDMLRLVNDLLDISKLQSQKLKLEVVEINLIELVADLERMLHPQALQNGNILEVHIQGGISTWLGDPFRVRQVLLNLLGNANKFTKNGHLYLDMALKEDKLQFIVRDTGIGMSDEQMQRIFNAFEQADNTSTRIYGGTGLGLTISKQLAELMGGEIGVQSELGKGSLFEICLPKLRTD